MKRWFIIPVLAMAALWAGCGTSVSSSTETKPNQVYSMALVPTQFTLNAGDWSSILAAVDLSTQNSAPKPISPQPTIEFTSSDPRITISPNGQVCAGQWDAKFQICSPTYYPAGYKDPVTGLPLSGLNLPTGYVVITAFSASHDVSNTSLVSVHQRAANITLSADWGINTKTSTPNLCLTQNQQPQVKYTATAYDGSGNPVGNVYDNDYVWTVADANVASVSAHGYVTARNPGVTSVYAKLNGTTSAPLAFATCPPAAIQLASSPYTGQTAELCYDPTTLKPTGNCSTADLDLNKGSAVYVTATGVDSSGNPMPLTDLNGNAINSLPLTFTSSDVLAGSLTSVTALTGKLTASTSGRFSVLAACEPATCNVAVPDYQTPNGVHVTGTQAGFGYPIYSNALGVTVEGTSGSLVLVTGTTFADGSTPAHELLVYDSESLAVIHTVALANTPNSLVVAPNGGSAFVGSDAGLMVVNLGSFQSSIQTFPVVGSNPNNPEYVTGKVIGVTLDSRYVIVSNLTLGYVYVVDTTVSRRAIRYNLPGIHSMSYAADGTNFWLGGDNGVYTYVADAFVPVNSYNPADASTLITGVNALVWMPDGQSYFASGSQLLNYSTCNDQNPTQPPSNLTALLDGGMAATTINGESHLLGLSATEWFDYPVATSSQVPGTEGFVCLASVTPATPVTAANTLACTPTQVRYAPTEDSNGKLSLPRLFITGVDPSCAAPDTFIHGYDVTSGTEIKIPTSTITMGSTNLVGTPYPVAPLSGGLLNDGRKLYFGTFDASTQTALLHRVNFDPTAGAVNTEDTVPVVDSTTGKITQIVVPATVAIVPSFVAVVPK